jgi:hypothetical protein
MAALQINDDDNNNNNNNKTRPDDSFAAENKDMSRAKEGVDLW